MKKNLLLIYFLFISANSFSQLSQTALNFNYGGYGYQGVSIPGNSFYNIGTGDFTVEAWIKFYATPFGTGAPIFSFNGDYYGLSLSIYNGNLTYCRNWGCATNIEYDFYADTACHHVAVVRSIGAVNAYIDGSVYFIMNDPDPVIYNNDHYGLVLPVSMFFPD
jgi:hypothetical protein